MYSCEICGKPRGQLVSLASTYTIFLCPPCCRKWDKYCYSLKQFKAICMMETQQKVLIHAGEEQRSCDLTPRIINLRSNLFDVIDTWVTEQMAQFTSGDVQDGSAQTHEEVAEKLAAEPKLSGKDEID